jgi:preprotein translocase subunit SecB
MSESNTQSVLQIPRVVFDEMTFKRHGFKTQSEEKLEFGLQSKIDKDGDGKYRVSLRVRADRKDEYEITMQITGYCEIDENDPNKDVLLSQNAVAILFPYIRAELSLLTAQPDTDPIVLPVLNINAALEQSKFTQKGKETSVE